MKNIRVGAALSALLVLGAASADAQRTPDVRGLHLGAAFSATSVKLDQTEVSDDDRDGGIGINLQAGYNFTRNLGLLLGVSGATVDADDADDYGVAHVDLLGRASFPGRSALVPYVELGITGVGISYTPDLEEEVELRGGGLTLGAGINYFFSRRAAFDLGLRFTGGEIDDAEVADREVELGDEVGFRTTRLNIGFAFYP